MYERLHPSNILTDPALPVTFIQLLAEQLEIRTAQVNGRMDAGARKIHLKNLERHRERGRKRKREKESDQQSPTVQAPPGWFCSTHGRHPQTSWCRPLEHERLNFADIRNLNMHTWDLAHMLTVQSKALRFLQQLLHTSESVPFLSTAVAALDSKLYLDQSRLFLLR